MLRCIATPVRRSGSVGRVQETGERASGLAGIEVAAVAVAYKKEGVLVAVALLPAEVVDALEETSEELVLEKFCV